MTLLGSAPHTAPERWPDRLQVVPEIDAHLLRLGLFTRADGPERAGQWIALWCKLTCESPPTPAQAIEAYCRTLKCDSDLSADQIAEIRTRLFASPRTSSLSAFLETTLQRFEHRVRPWFPIWQAYAGWTMQWCVQNRCRQTIFLCRDSLPFYVLASKWSTPPVRQSRATPSVRLLHASRRLVRSAEFDLHLSRTVRPGDRAALIDTGCYGSIIPELLSKLGDKGLHTDPAVIFFFSRNPLLFGYMNYLTSWDLLGAELEASGGSLLDFVIYAGDFVEALPKPYRIGGLTPDGVPTIQTPDLISFALGSWLLSKLSGSWPQSANDPVALRDAALRASRDLRTSLAREQGTLRKSPRLLFADTAPKDPPQTPDYRALWDIAPQEAVFGTTTG